MFSQAFDSPLQALRRPLKPLQIAFEWLSKQPLPGCSSLQHPFKGREEGFASFLEPLKSLEIACNRRSENFQNHLKGPSKALHKPFKCLRRTL